MGNGKNREVVFCAISQINFPFKSRKYLMTALKQAVQEQKAKFIVLAGNTIAGRYLEAKLKQILKSIKDKDEKSLCEEQFIGDMAQKLNEFLPKINNVNYHIVIAEKVYDRPIGVRILENLQFLRDDIRIINDPEAKVPIKDVDGVDYIRVLVPTKVPWYAKNISNLIQRVTNSFVDRTFSPRPSLIIVGCAGADIFLPFYESVPCVGLATFYKLEERQSTENTTGITFIKLTSDNGCLNVKKGYGDLKWIITKERELVIQALEKVPAQEKEILSQFINIGSMSFNALKGHFRNNIKEDDLQKIIDKLLKKKFLAFDGQSNRYNLNEVLLEKVKISWAHLKSGTTKKKYTVFACVHTGGLRTEYFTITQDLPVMAEESNALVCLGDILMGLEHTLNASGEVLPMALGYDKQEIIAAYLMAKAIMNCFERRMKKGIEGCIPSSGEIIDRCLIPFIFIPGNHDLWELKNKQGLPLYLFENKLKQILTEKIMLLLPDVRYEIVFKAVEGKVIKVGESGIINIDGLCFGLAHPHKPRTLTKSQRLQEVINYLIADRQEINAAFIGNFHEAAQISYSKFGRTILGVMAGAFVTSSDFENYKQKKVNYGAVRVEIETDADKNLIWSEIEFCSNVHFKDRERIFKEKFSASDTMSACVDILKEIDLEDFPWR